MPLTNQSTRFCQKSLITATTLVTIITLTGCATTKIGSRDTARAIMDQRVSVLSGSRLSSDTKSRLVQAGLDEEKCLANMPACVVTLKQADLNSDKGIYGAISELFYASAQQRQQAKTCTNPPKDLATDYAKDLVGKTDVVAPKPDEISCTTAFQDDMLQSIRFSYIYLMYDILNPTVVNQQPSQLYYLPKERDTQIQDLYYAAIDALGDRLYHQKMAENYQITRNNLRVNINGQPFTDKSASMKLISSYQIDLSKFNTISRRDGFGINYVALLNSRINTAVIIDLLQHYANDTPLEERIHQTGHLPMTAVLVPKGNTIDELQKTTDFSLNIYDPYQFKSVSILNKDFALSANFSAAYGLWSQDNRLGNISYLSLFASPYQQTQPHLFMLEPYNPNKRVIIMMHGLASSPETWIGLTNDIFNDPKLRENFQVWQIFYPTNIPMLENRHQIYDLIERTFKTVDPEQQDVASQHSVLIGHSMGGVIGRLLVSNDDLTPKVESLVANYSQLNNFSAGYAAFVRHAQNKTLSDRFKLQALPQVDRAIFISSPFRGTDYADRWFTRSLRRIISLPAGFIRTAYGNLNSLFTEGVVSSNPLAQLFLENGASQLSNHSYFNQLTADVTIAPNVAVNNIIATDDKDLSNALEQLTAKAANSPTDDVSASITSLKNDNTTATVNPATQTKLYNTTNLAQAKQSLDEKKQLLESVKYGATDRVSDGIVPYDSSHLEGVESEKVLTGRHNVHTSPQAILELRRILHQQLARYGVTQAPSDRQP